jgi:hypothetical protein
MLFKIDHEKLELVRGLMISKIEEQRTIISVAADQEATKDSLWSS